MSDDQKPIGYRALIYTQKNWRYLWLGQIVSLLGDWFNLIASASLIASLTGSGFAISGLFVVRALAPFLISPFAGVLTDRYNRKYILIGYAISGVGSGLGPIGARAITGDHIQRLRHAIIVGYFIAAIGLSITSTLHSFPIVLLGGLMRSFGSGIAWVFSTQLLLQLVPTHVRGRVFSFEQATFALTSALSAAASGVLLDQFPGVSNIILGMAIITLIPCILWGLWCYKRPLDNNFTADK